MQILPPYTKLDFTHTCTSLSILQPDKEEAQTELTDTFEPSKNTQGVKDGWYRAWPGKSSEGEI